MDRGCATSSRPCSRVDNFQRLRPGPAPKKSRWAKCARWAFAACWSIARTTSTAKGVGSAPIAEPNEVRLSDLEPLFVRQTCGTRPPISGRTFIGKRSSGAKKPVLGCSTLRLIAPCSRVLVAECLLDQGHCLMAWKPKYPEPQSSSSLRFSLSWIARAVTQNAAVAVPSALIGAALCWTLLSFIPWHPLEILKHVAAFPNCSAARAVGVAPSYRGRPGYWSKHDRDNDGISCEIWPRR